MGITFKSKATGDLFMLSAHAAALLGPLGKQVERPGILTAAELPAAIAHLKALPDDAPRVSPADDEADQDHERDQDRERPLVDSPVSLHKRAVPMVRMFEQALAAGQDVVWGV